MIDDIENGVLWANILLCAALLLGTILTCKLSDALSFRIKHTLLSNMKLKN